MSKRYCLRESSVPRQIRSAPAERFSLRNRAIRSSMIAAGILSFLGSSRLEEPINRFRVNAVFHGHAHDGILEGKTSTSIPVYNVSAPRASQNRQTLSNCRAVAALYGRRQRRARYAKLSRSQRAMPPHQRGFVSVKCTGQLSTNQKPLEKTALQLSGPNGAVFAPTSSYKASLSVA